MKHTLFIFALLTATIQTFAQSPRIKLNQITKDSVTGSVLISSPTDSGMVYSRDLFISYGADTVLILGGDTLAKTSGIISSVLSDGVTITGDGTSGSELTADTSVLATLRALSDSLALVISSVTADNVTITGDGTVGSPLQVDTATVVASVGRLLDSLINVRTDLDLKQDQLNGTGFVKATGTTISYDNSTYLTTEVDGSVTNEIQDISTSGAAGNISISSGSTLNLNVDDADASASNELQTLSYNSGTNEITLSDGGGTEDLSNLDLVDSTRINATGDTAYYYQNGVLIGTGAIAGGGGGTTYNNISETVDTVFIDKFLNVDTATLYVQSDSNRVGIGTSTPTSALDIVDGTIKVTNALSNKIEINQTGVNDAFFTIGNATSGTELFRPVFWTKGNTYDQYYANGFIFDVTKDTATAGPIAVFDARQNNTTVSNRDLYHFKSLNTTYMVIEANGEVGIGTANPAHKLDVVGTAGLSTGTAWTNTSDVRYKKIRDNLNTQEYLNKLLQLTPISFQWNELHQEKYKSDLDKTNYGFLAQEVETVFPSMVTTDDDGYKWYNPSGFEAILTGAIKQQQSIIETQATEIETLKTLITELSNRLQILENN